MKIDLQLKKHCIQTAAKTTYERLIRAYMKGAPTGSTLQTVEDQIEGLKFFLEKCDFPHMRSTYPELSGKEAVVITLEIPREKKDMTIACRDREIYPKWKES